MNNIASLEEILELVDICKELSRHMKTTGNRMIPVFLPEVVDELRPPEEGRDRDVAVLLHSAQGDSTQSSPFTCQGRRA